MSDLITKGVLFDLDGVLVRKSRYVSQERLALIAGLDRTYISLVERGLRSPTIRTVVRLAEVLDVRPSEVVRCMEELLPKWRRTARS